MDLTISWVNRTPSADNVLVFRGDEPFAESALPAPLDTIAGNASSYTDTGLEFGKTYYYRTQTVKGTERATSALLKAIATTYTGPGPQELISGDTECGFFGEVTEQELDNPSLVMTRAVGVGATYGTSPNWLKFYYRGKILYVAKQMLANVSYLSLYTSKVTTGQKGAPKYPLSSAPTLEQYREDIIRGQRFIVRTLDGDNDRGLGFMPSSPTITDNVAGLRDCEFSDLIFGVINKADLKLAKRKLASYPIAEICPNYVVFDYVQQVTSGGGGYPVLRSGYNSPNSAYAGSYITTNMLYSQYPLVIGGGSTYLYCGWRPVLEWVGPAL